MPDARYTVGLDLGTTNSVISYVDMHAEGDEASVVKTLPVAQLVGPGALEPRDTLPSFMYLAAGPEFAPGALDLPWAANQDFAVGVLARDFGSQVPTRLVGSAKSWLSYGGADRTAPILPWQAPEEVQKVSPVAASARYLAHLRGAWNSAMAADDPSARLERQEVYLTVPASFDAVARELTVRAAKEAGLPAVTLLEEPQAAFYAWLAHQGDDWRQQLGVGDVVLVCDVGGGTTDFSLIAVGEREGELELERIAVGEHILLGGDNMDLALALNLAQGLGERHKLDAWQSRALWHSCRLAKEQLLGDPDLERAPVTILGRGSKVVGGTIKAELLREDLTRIVLGGFFPACEASDRPAQQRRVGIQELGLPYAADAAVTKHLAKFLGRHLPEGSPAGMPTAVLYNGGVMKATPLRQQLTEVLSGWAGAAVRQLESAGLDLAVSRGAAYYGLVRHGRGIRIRGGAARSYYIGIESAMPAVPGAPAPLKALCVVPFGMEEGSEATIQDKEFGMLVGEPAEFRFFSSTTRKEDPIGTVLDRWGDEELRELVPIQTAMETDDEAVAPGTTVPVTLHSRVTEVGTLDLRLHARDGRSWELEYNVRDTAHEA